jgi:hypothetical protein
MAELLVTITYFVVVRSSDFANMCILDWIQGCTLSYMIDDLVKI